MSGAKWTPSDAELDAVARTLPADEPTPERAEQARTNLLATAAITSQRSRRAIGPAIAITAALAVAAAAAVALWLASRPGPHDVAVAPERPTPSGDGPKQVIEAIGEASLAKVHDWPDYIVHVDQGRVAITVAKLEPNERFRVQTADAEVEVRGTRFAITVEASRLVLVDVKDGRVEVRRPLEPPVTIGAGQRWAPPTKTAAGDTPPTHGANATESSTTDTSIAAKQSPASSATTRSGARDRSITANRPSTTAASATTQSSAPDTSIAAKQSPATASTATTQSSARDTSPAANRSAATDKAIAVSRPSAGESAAPAPAAPKPPDITGMPGEAEFRAGVAALRGGDAGTATKAFGAACRAAAGDALGEDACFWVGAAAKRAGDIATARAALAAFLDRFSGSARAGEAAALLGWILLDAGELDAAAQRFDQAAHDRVPRVRESAERGREAIRRKRAAR